ncbi:unnamed protein product, partial [Choristocarpus tenellus]
MGAEDREENSPLSWLAQKNLSLRDGKRLVYDNVEEHVLEVQKARRLFAQHGERQDFRNHMKRRGKRVVLESISDDRLSIFEMDWKGEIRRVRARSLLQVGSIYLLMNAKDKEYIAAYEVGEQEEQYLIVGPNMACTPWLLNIPQLPALKKNDRKGFGWGAIFGWFGGDRRGESHRGMGSHREECLPSNTDRIGMGICSNNLGDSPYSGGKEDKQD